MLEILLAASLSCGDAKELIGGLKRMPPDMKKELTEVIKSNTEAGCYERSEHNS